MTTTTTTTTIATTFRPALDTGGGIVTEEKAGRPMTKEVWQDEEATPTVDVSDYADPSSMSSSSLSNPSHNGNSYYSESSSSYSSSNVVQVNVMRDGPCTGRHDEGTAPKEEEDQPYDHDIPRDYDMLLLTASYHSDAASSSASTDRTGNCTAPTRTSTNNNHDSGGGGGAIKKKSSNRNSSSHKLCCRRSSHKNRQHPRGGSQSQRSQSRTPLLSSGQTAAGGHHHVPNHHNLSNSNNNINNGNNFDHDYNQANLNTTTPMSTSSSSSSSSSSAGFPHESAAILHDNSDDSDEETGGAAAVVAKTNAAGGASSSSSTRMVAVCGTYYPRSWVVLAGLLVLLLVVALLTAVGFAVSTSSGSSGSGSTSGSNAGGGERSSPSDGAVPTTPTTPPRLCSTARCGASWHASNSQCGVPCGISRAQVEQVEQQMKATAASDADSVQEQLNQTFATFSCPTGEFCFADLNADLDCCNDDTSELDGNDEQDDASSTTTTETMEDPDAPQAEQPPSTTNTTAACATVRCGTNWMEANDVCGVQCLTQPCPSGQACFADLNAALDCCASSTESWEPEFNEDDDDQDVPAEQLDCTTTRCGDTWANANNFCYANCQTDDDCPGATQRCYADLTTTLDCCVASSSSSTTNAGTSSSSTSCSTNRCGFTFGLANEMCHDSCEVDEDCPGGQRCFANLRTDLDCCSEEPDQEQQEAETAENENDNDFSQIDPNYSCSSTRCGLDWTHAATTCGLNCLNDGDCPGSAPRCYADLSTNLECCPTEQEDEDDDEEEALDEESISSTPIKCTTTRCGLTWGVANTQCGLNCVSFEDCTEPGHTCFADLSVDLDCCSNTI